jgi:predicted flap endonuclease-1-like 5' DNA nuclease
MATDLPNGLSQPAIRALAGVGVTTLDQLTEFRERDLADLHGMGPKGVRILREALAERGLTFAS